jgi:hypothetical protein
MTFERATCENWDFNQSPTRPLRRPILNMVRGAWYLRTSFQGPASWSASLPIFRFQSREAFGVRLVEPEIDPNNLDKGSNRWLSLDGFCTGPGTVSSPAD